MESEFISLTESVDELTWYSRFYSELNLYYKLKPVHYCDNESAIFFRNIVKRTLK